MTSYNKTFPQSSFSGKEISYCFCALGPASYFLQFANCWCHQIVSEDSKLLGLSSIFEESQYFIALFNCNSQNKETEYSPQPLPENLHFHNGVY